MRPTSATDLEPRSPEANPRASLAAFLSFLFPGLGQAYNGDSWLAWILATPAFLLVAGVALALATVGSSLLARLFDIRFLLGLIALDLALLGWRLVAVVQAHGHYESANRRRWTTWVTGLLVVATLGMHGLPAWYAAKAIDTLDAVALGGSAGSIDDSLPVFSGLPEPSGQPDVAAGERVNVLLVGVDSAPGRVTALTDTMLVVSLDTLGTRSAMISIPRDLYGAPLPNGQPFNNKLNALMTYADARPDEFPLGGVGTLKATIGRLLGVPIHYFAAINLLGFKQAVDAIGGVDITVTRAINDPTYYDEYGKPAGFYLQPGTYHMDGHTALAFVRSRKGVGDSDFTRADRQQQLLAALREQLTAGNLLLSLPGLLDAVKNTIATDVPGDRMPELAQAVQDADMSLLKRIVLQPPDYMTADPYSSAGYILVPNLAAIRAIGAALLAEPTIPPEAQP
jgi:LCP family protein required for cell wall assembly